MLSLLVLIAGLLLLLFSADILIRGASGLARALGVSSLVIGLTVVAFGTSAPELAVNILSAKAGQTSLAFGNIIGSCMVNIAVVLGLTAMVRPLDVRVSIITREMPILLLGVAAVIALAADRILGDASATNGLSRQDGIVTLLIFSVFLYGTVYQVLSNRQSDAFVEEVGKSVRHDERHPWRDSLFTIGGLIGVALGGELVVKSAVSIAHQLGFPDTIIGLTIVSIGTTLPELVTCLSAARRGLSDVAIGNVVGSCIFNLLFIGGVVATIRPMPLPHHGELDLAMLAFLSAILLPICIRGPRKVTRTEGATLFLLYLAYTIVRITLFSH